MAKLLLADANIQGHIDRLVKRMQGEPWIGFWNDLQLQWVRFADVGLDASDSDAVVWQRCQDRQLYLITNNRNDDGPDSLENTIRTLGTSRSLPIFTIGDGDRTLHDRDYAAEVIWKLFERLYDIENLLGTGRLFLP